MMVEQPKYKTSDEVDFVIVGSGAAGGILAKELSTNGFRVVVLEQGPYLTEADYTHNEIKILGEDLLTNHPKLQPNTFRKTPQDKAKRSARWCTGAAWAAPACTSPRISGASTKSILWSAAKSARFPAPTLVDWPIKYADLEPYYTKVEWESWRFGAGGREPVRSAALEAVSDAAIAGEILRRDFRTRALASWAGILFRRRWRFCRSRARAAAPA